MGFQFCGFFRCNKQIDEFAAVRSNQMTSGSRQAYEPPRFVEFYIIACIFKISQKESVTDFQNMLLGGHAYETYNFLRVRDPD